ncbi:MAG: glycosyltransferase [Candidatus Altiarchaeales archaeon]|nr:glycosyltransferase [Candidatus Altiarchaeales archaeon]
MFKLIVVGGPAEAYIERCLTSIISQTEGEWSAQVMLDPVGDKSYEKAKKFESDKLHVHLNENQRYALPNIIQCVKLLRPSDEDILVTVDADDWLYDEKALATVRRYYDTTPGLLLTHGTWYGYPDPTAVNNSAPYYRPEFEAGVRRAVWKGTHLRTFKYKLWKNIKDNDLRDSKGEYYKCAWDLAFMWPMMEMAGYDRIKYIPEKLYVYNRETPHNDEKVRSGEQQRNHQEIMTKEPYKRIDSW